MDDVDKRQNVSNSMLFSEVRKIKGYQEFNDSMGMKVLEVYDHLKDQIDFSHSFEDEEAEVEHYKMELYRCLEAAMIALTLYNFKTSVSIMRGIITTDPLFCRKMLSSSFQFESDFMKRVLNIVAECDLSLSVNK